MGQNPVRHIWLQSRGSSWDIGIHTKDRWIEQWKYHEPMNRLVILDLADEPFTNWSLYTCIGLIVLTTDAKQTFSEALKYFSKQAPLTVACEQDSWTAVLRQLKLSCRLWKMRPRFNCNATPILSYLLAHEGQNPETVLQNVGLIDEWPLRLMFDGTRPMPKTTKPFLILVTDVIVVHGATKEMLRQDYGFYDELMIAQPKEVINSNPRLATHRLSTHNAISKHLQPVVFKH
ncbi:hypothetical protein TNIN_373171 [Trichonephila inaurata madagascariensis]|uniref:Uncharacterized protein n=1 Tax=Trichonephila inaurata madagascariensis TaxID=2747483 RepID=A0A8X6Y9G1_9ARAC|nr:hypothetical protein TNIN_373171 [Trichonephila inaurata madagascariensis]